MWFPVALPAVLTTLPQLLWEKTQVHSALKSVLGPFLQFRRDLRQVFHGKLFPCTIHPCMECCSCPMLPTAASGWSTQWPQCFSRGFQMWFWSSCAAAVCNSHQQLASLVVQMPFHTSSCRCVSSLKHRWNISIYPPAGTECFAVHSCGLRHNWVL